MAEEINPTATIETAEDAASRVYEVGYHVVSTVKEEDLETVVGGIRSEIEKNGGSFIAEGAPALTRLAYVIASREGEKRIDHDRAYFGWIKFESSIEASRVIDSALKANPNVLRHMLFETVREDTRAKMKPLQIREVKRVDTIKTTARRPEEAAAPVSEEQLEKAIEDITAE